MHIGHHKTTMIGFKKNVQIARRPRLPMKNSHQGWNDGTTPFKTMEMTVTAVVAATDGEVGRSFMVEVLCLEGINILILLGRLCYGFSRF